MWLGQYRDGNSCGCGRDAGGSQVSWAVSFRSVVALRAAIELT